MNAKKCDRCTKFYEPYPGDQTNYHSNMIIFAEDKNSLTGAQYIESRIFELCPRCMSDACRFMMAKLA